MTDQGLISNSAMQQLPYISNAVSSVQLAADGELAAAANEAAGLRQGVGTLIADPLHALISEGLGFLLSVVEPLNQMIELVTGDNEALSKSAADFGALSQDMISLAEETAGMLDANMASWGGGASMAARQRLADALCAIKGTGGEAARLQQTLELSSTVMAAAEQFIRDILATLVEWLIITWVAALASAVATLGASTAAASSATTAEAAVACSRGARVVRKVTSVLRRIMGVLSKIATRVSRLASRMKPALKSELVGTARDSLTGAGKSIGASAVDDGWDMATSPWSSDSSIESGLHTPGETGR